MTKTAWSSVVFFGLFFIVSAAGFQCYECILEKGIPGIPGVTEHKKCHEGKLPEDLLVNCEDATKFGGGGLPLNATQIASLTGQGVEIGWACGKFHTKSGSNELAVKGCTHKTAAQEECGEGTAGGHKGRKCECHTEKCNGVRGLLPSFLLFGLSIFLLKSSGSLNRTQ